MKTVIEMAHEAGAWSQQSKNCDVEYVMSGESLERFAALVAAAEREACAKVCDVLAEDYGKAGLPMTYQALAGTAKEIRARGETK